MNRLEKMEHLQINLNTWFSEWASYANEKERIGARMLNITSIIIITENIKH